MPRKGYKQSPEHIEKRGKVLRERWEALTEEEREERRRSGRERWNGLTEEEREEHRRSGRERYRVMYGEPKTAEERRAANAEYMRKKRAAARQGEDLQAKRDALRAKRDAIIAAARPILERVERAKREASTTTDAPYGYVRKERPL